MNYERKASTLWLIKTTNDKATGIIENETPTKITIHTIYHTKKTFNKNEITHEQKLGAWTP